MINDSDKEIFIKHYIHYECWKKHSFVKNYEKDVYNDLLYLYTKYVSDKHNFSHWCSSCRAELVNALYTWYIVETNEKVVTKKVAEPVSYVWSNPDTENIVVEQVHKKRGRKPKK